MHNPVCFVICNNPTSNYTQKSQTIASAASLLAWLALTITFIKYWKLESHNSYVPTGMAFLKPGHKCVPNVPFQDTGTWRSKSGLSRSNRDVWSPWVRCQVCNEVRMARMLDYREDARGLLTSYFGLRAPEIYQCMTRPKSTQIKRNQICIYPSRQQTHLVCKTKPIKNRSVYRHAYTV